MASYKSFEDLPVWQRAIELAAEIFELTAKPVFKFRGDLVNQIRRASLSVSNNIAEGFERGSTSDLINFLYIARGSCGETRSMLRFATKLGGMDAESDAVSATAEKCTVVSRQLYGWIESLKNSEVKGQRHLDDKARIEYVRSNLSEEFHKEFNPTAEDRSIVENRHAEYLKAKFEALMALKDAERSALTTSEAPTCPACGAKMARRHDRNGRAFWGCVNYPTCRGSRPA